MCTRKMGFLSWGLTIVLLFLLIAWTTSLGQRAMRAYQPTVSISRLSERDDGGLCPGGEGMGGFRTVLSVRGQLSLCTYFQNAAPISQY